MLAFLAFGVASADAQWIWFNSAGVSIGGGPMRFHGETIDPVVSFIRPTYESGGAVDAGGFLAAGTHRFALLLPEFHVVEITKSDKLPGTLTAGAQSVPVEWSDQTVSAMALFFGGRVALLPKDRLSIRGGIGKAWLSRHLTAGGDSAHPDVTLDVGGPSGLSAFTAVGFDMWSKQLERVVIAVNAEFDYVAARADHVQLRMPSGRVGFTIFPSRRKPAAATTP